MDHTASDQLFPVQVNLHDSRIRVNGVEEPIVRWGVKFMAPSGVVDNLSDLPEDDRWIAIPVPVAYSDNMFVLCVNGDYETNLVADNSVDGGQHGSEGEPSGDPGSSPITPGDIGT